MVLGLAGNQHLRLVRAAQLCIKRTSVAKFGALATAIGITFTIVWSLSSYGYPSADARGAPAFAAKVAGARPCL